MSIDLRYPLVSSMGQHDALDGYITSLELYHSASGERDIPEELLLDMPIADLLKTAKAVNWKSDDPLGIGGLMSDACLLAQLIVKEGRNEELSVLLDRMLNDALDGIKAFMQTETLKHPAQYRLAFREIGLSIGLHGIPKIKSLLSQHA